MIPTAEYIRMKRLEAAAMVTDKLNAAGITYTDTGTEHVVRVHAQRGQFETLLSLTPEYPSSIVKYRVMGSARSKQGGWFGTDMAGFLGRYGYSPELTPLPVPETPESFTFGKYRGKTYAEVAANDKKYLEWMLTGNFKPEQLEAARTALANEYEQEQIKQEVASIELA